VSESAAEPEVVQEDQPRIIKRKRKIIPLQIEDEDEKLHDCYLREMSGKRRDEWLNKMGDNMKMADGKPTGVKKFDAVQAGLIAECLYYTEGDRPVTIKELQEWGSSALVELFEICQNMNGLNEKGREEAKKA